MAKKPRLGSGERFKALHDKIMQEMMDKGMSKEEADKKASAMAAAAGRAAHGSTKMAKWSKAGRKRAAK